MTEAETPTRKQFSKTDNPPDHSAPDHSIKKVMRRYGISSTTVWLWGQTRGFPSPVRLGPQTNRWRLCDLKDWEARMAEEA